MKFKFLNLLTLSTFLFMVLVGCSNPTPKEKLNEKLNNTIQKNEKCMQEGVISPKWICSPHIDGFYSGVGVAEYSVAGINHMRTISAANARNEISRQIKLNVKNKVELFTRSTGAKNQSIDKVNTEITKQLTNIDLSNSYIMDVWSAPSGAYYTLVVVNKDDVNNQISSNINSSYKNDNALWQQFQSKQSLKELEKDITEN